VYRPATASPEISYDNCKIPLSTSRSSYRELSLGIRGMGLNIVDINVFLLDVYKRFCHVFNVYKNNF